MSPILVSAWDLYVNPTESQVISFSVEKVATGKEPRNAKNEVVNGGKIIVSLQWINGPAKFMSKYASARPLQDYSADFFKD